MTTRAHVNVAELTMLEMVMNYIAKERWTKCGISTEEIEGIGIITDSQNCLSLMQQKDSTNDEVMIHTLRQIENHYRDIEEQKWEKESIELYWVHSHDKSKVNDDVDEVAKMASKLVEIRYSNDALTETLLPYEYIAYQQMKKEVKKRSELIHVKWWNKYRYNKGSDEWGQHLKRWNIRSCKKWYQEELKYLNKRQNQIRILLYTGKLPTNEFIHFNLKQKQISPFCEFCDFGAVQTEDTIRHRLIDCIAKREGIELLTSQIRNWYKLSEIDFKDDPEDDDYIKQFIFPQMKSAYVRMEILTSVIEYLLCDDPDLIKKAEKFW